jgi:hypothetical protein
MDIRKPRVGAIVLVAIATLAVRAAPLSAQACAGDCDGSGSIGVGELVLAVNVALGRGRLAACPASDANRDGALTIDELIGSVSRSMSGCPRRQGSGAVEDATRVITTVPETVRRVTLEFGSAGVPPGGADAGGGAGAVQFNCDQGSRTIDCLDGGSGSSTRVTEYASCVLTEDGITVQRNGIERMTVGEPRCPAAPAPTSAHTLELEAYFESRRSGSVQLATITVPGIFRRRVVPGARTCTPFGGGILRDETVTVDGTLQTTCNPQAAADCSASLTDLELTAQNLVAARTYAPPACDLSTVLDGGLFVNNASRSAGETFAQTFAAYRISESLIAGRRLVREDGRVNVDCLGEVRVETMETLAMEPGGDICPGQGALRVFLGSNAGAGGGAGLAGGGASSRSEQGGLIDSTFRAANGQVYQILQNPNGFPEARTEDVRVTTVAASADGISDCSDRSLGRGEAQAVVAAEPGTLIPADDIRLSGTLQLASAPCFNPNGEAGNGLVCLGDGCSRDCRCPNQGCITFTIAQGTAFGAPSIGGRIVAALPPFGGDCGGAAGDSTYAFGPSGPTLVPGLCGALPADDGFLLLRGQSRIIAYDTAPSVRFFSGAAGFLIDRDGDNQSFCVPGSVISGFATENELGAALVTFDQRSVSFDVNDDGAVERSVADCEDLSIAECGLPPPTATATPDVPRQCPETRNVSPPLPPDSTRNSFNLVPGAASCGDGGIVAPDRSFLFRAPAAGCYRIDTLDTGGLARPFDTLLYVRSGDSCAGAEIACNDNAAPAVLQSEVFVELDLAQNVVIVVDGNAGASGDFRLRIEPVEGECPVETTPTATASPTLPSSPTSSASATATSSATATPTSTASRTLSPSATATSSSTPSPTVTPTPTTAASSPTRTRTRTPTRTQTPPPLPSPTPTPTETTTPTEAPIPSQTPTRTRTRTPTRTQTPPPLPSPTPTPTDTPPPTPTDTPPPSQTPTRTRTRTPTLTATPGPLFPQHQPLRRLLLPTPRVGL